MNNFEYVGAAYRVVFGTGTLQELPSALQKMNAKAVIILSTPEQAHVAERVKGIIGTAGVAIFSEATMHTPTHITEKAVSVARRHDVDGIVSVGGGSTVGLGKAVSIRTGLPHLCIPTTYAGSEMTPILGETEDRRKVTRRDPKILPTSVLYDVDLFKTLPVGLTVYSGINAIAHAETHVIMLPHAMSYNYSAAPQAMAKLASALPEADGDAVKGINALYRQLGITITLKGLNMPESGIDEAADIAVSNPYKNPRLLERDAIREVIRRAWAGEDAVSNV
ncbi:hypothetical protein G7Z17_g3762 [Cylindrodendrum hubeiense]|uniref:Maleylacetate reductase n=1 Tax=Cylindrodendrum hubeiense TaxID=595255 RepID=A0A9P5HC01_9HYPO|nr:hypothetical protein G7Z17_g3762 [Cylindrodendrum hubeiense]